ncbi:hypothetical protein BRN88_00475, partial [Xanthomonas oryzae pv. oryzae]
MDRALAHDAATLANGVNPAGKIHLLLLDVLVVLVEAASVNMHQSLVVAAHALQLIGIVLTLLLDTESATL